MYFVGRVYGAADPGLDPKELDPNSFSADQHAALDLSGHPIYDEHDTTRRVGRVLRSFTSPHDSTKFILGRIEPAEDELRAQVRTGAKRELSMTHAWHAQFKDDGTEVQTRIPLEVSLTKQGNRPNCDIIYHFEKDMSAAPVVAAASPVAPAAPVGSPIVAAAPPVASAPVQAQAQAPVPDVYDEQKLVEALQADNMSTEDAIKYIAALSTQLNEARARLGSLSSQTQSQEEMARAQYVELAKQWLAMHERNGIPLDPAFVNSTMDMHGRPPQEQVLIMSNNVRAMEHMEHKVNEAMAKLNTEREFFAAKRAKKPGKASAYLDTQLRSHTPGTASYAKTGGHSGLFQNSVYTTAVAEAVESPAFRRGFASQLDVQPPVASQDPEAFRKKLMGLQIGRAHV